MFGPEGSFMRCHSSMSSSELNTHPRGISAISSAGGGPYSRIAFERAIDRSTTNQCAGSSAGSNEAWKSILGPVFRLMSKALRGEGEATARRS